MKCFLIFLATGLVASDKLDHTYLPPPGAQYSGGNLGDHDVPLQPPDHSHSGPVTLGHEGSQTTYGLNGEPVNFGDKIPKIPFSYYQDKVPTTTTSYAFSQTTTFPPSENYETTVLPTNPITGLPVNLDQAYRYGFPQGQQDVQNNPTYGQNQGQETSYGTNVQTNFGPTSAPATLGNTNYAQSEDQPLSQYPGQNINTPGGLVQIPGSVYEITNQNQGQNQYPGAQGNTKLQVFPASGVPGGKGFVNYPEPNVVNPGGTVQIPGGNQNFIQNPDIQITGQGFAPSTTSSTNILPGDSQYGENYDGSQGTYSDQPRPQLNQASYQNRVPENIERLSESGSTPSNIPSYYNDVTGTTPLPGVPSSTYSSVNPVYRPERPQAAADRNAVILNYENVRTPNSYSYSFDTSNGIHADESGVVDNGTKAQGAYSYIGDDGKVYSVIYTADENGFQPRGDHLPTPPPIPDAIKRVIEQAARDKEAGIIDDGSYDQAKYGDKKYILPANRRRPQKLNSNNVDNKSLDEANDDNIKTIAGINDSEYDKGIQRDKFNKDFPITETRKQVPNKNVPSRPTYQINGKSSGKNNSEGNRRLSGDNVSLDLGQNGTPIIKEGINDLNNYGTKNPISSDDRPMFGEDNISYAKDANKSKQFRVKNRRPSERHPISSGANNMKTKYPGPQIDVDRTDYPGTERDEYHDTERQDIETSGPTASDELGENSNTDYDSVTGAPIKIKQSLKQRVKGNRRPSTKITEHNTDGKPQGNVFSKETTDTPSISDYIKNAAKQPTSNVQVTQQDASGYYYRPPNTKFEQTNFPTRFNTQYPEVSSDSNPDQRRTEFNKNVTRRPFITPNVNSQNDETRQSTTGRPFTTVGVTSPVDSSYTDYDNGDDYGTNQDIDDEGINYNNLNDKSGSSYRPNQGTSTTLKPQYNPDVQRIRVTQKDSVHPGLNIENSVTPGYRFDSTTPMPSQNSRFGSTENPQTKKFQRRKPLTTNSDFSTAVGRPVTTPIPSRTPVYKYQTMGPVSEYYTTSAVPGYPTSSVFPGIGLASSTPGSISPQSYTTSTYRPSQSYSSTTVVPPTSEYNPDYGTRIPTNTPVVYQTPGSYQTGYYYGPPNADYSLNVSPNTGRPDLGFFIPSGTPGTTPIQQQGPNGFPSTTTAPIIPGRLGPFTQSQQGNIAPTSSPIKTYQANFQYGPSSPNYSTPIASTPGGGPVIGYPGASSSPNGYDYGSSSPMYSATNSPSTFGTTPTSFIPGVPTQGYSTTYRPGFQTTEDTFISGPVVDGFGRPITVEQGGSHPGFHQGTKGPIGNEGPIIVGNEQSTAYPDHSRVIGEDFSGPKQPQRYDPKTGYHY